MIGGAGVSPPFFVVCRMGFYLILMQLGAEVMAWKSILRLRVVPYSYLVEAASYA